MSIIILSVFIIGYIMIATEHNVKIDKAATALFIGVFCWTLLVVGFHEPLPYFAEGFENLGASHYFSERLAHHIEEISGILLFLMGAMTIVEIIDAHDGFKIITDKITTRKKSTLLWVVAILTFFLSAALDNLTTAIVMISLLRKLIPDQKTRWLFGGVVVIAANSGGAWSPIGDVTTTMLWIGGQITSANIIQQLLLPSLISLLIPLTFISYQLKGELESIPSQNLQTIARKEQNIALLLGLGGLLFVPIFKQATHLPPFMGIMLSLGVLWIATDIMHGRKLDEEKSKYTALHALRKIDMPSILFFLGILLAVGALQEIGLLASAAVWLKEQLNNPFAINLVIGVLSAIIDNVPLVAASIGMYPVTEMGSDVWANYFIQDGVFWEFLAYCAGTGGSILIIGSAAGVAVMGLEKINFGWYLKKISLWALLGYLAGGFTYILLHA